MKQSEWLIAQKVQKREPMVPGRGEEAWQGEENKAETEGKDLVVAMARRLFTKESESYNFNFNNKKYVKYSYLHLSAKCACLNHDTWLYLLALYYKIINFEI